MRQDMKFPISNVDMKMLTATAFRSTDTGSLKACGSNGEN
jgi:hypothetical protein